jgi:hypothetical protein
MNKYSNFLKVINLLFNLKPMAIVIKKDPGAN